MHTTVLSPNQVGERLLIMTEGMRVAGVSSGQMAVAGAHILLEHIPEEFGVPHELVARLEGSGLELQARQIVDGFELNEGWVNTLNHRYAKHSRWPNSSKEDDYDDDTEEDTQTSLRDAVMSSGSAWLRGAEPLYKHFSNVVDGFINGSPELAGTLATLEGVYDQHGVWGRRFTAHVVEALAEEGHLDAALLASNQAASVKTVEHQLLKMAKGGYRPAVLRAHSRFEAEGIYGRSHYYSSDDGGVRQLTPDFFETALALGIVDVASRIFDSVRNYGQLDDMLRSAISVLVERNDFTIEQLLSGGISGLTEKVLLGIINDFNLVPVQADDKPYTEESRRHWSTTPSEDGRMRGIQSTILFNLGVELCYRGRVNEAEQIEAANISERGHKTELQRFIGLGHFIASDIQTALSRYKEVQTFRVRDKWLQRESIPYLARRGAIGEALLMAAGLYNVDEGRLEFGEHSSYLLALAVAAAHDVHEDGFLPQHARRLALADEAVERSVSGKP